MMDFFYFDASALAKRYLPENGSDAVNRIFQTTPWTHLMCLTLGATETVSIFVRHRNDGRISPAFFSQALIQLHAEVIHNPDFVTLETDDRTVIDSIGFIVRYSINATDAVVLVNALQIHDECQQQGNRLILVSSDRRLNRAAQTEGLTAFNPETDDLTTLSF